MSNAIVNWEYYSSLYNLINNTEFSRYETLAEKQIKVVIGVYQWDRIDSTAFYYDQLKDCICKVANKIAEQDHSAIGKGISNVSNDGYSETYVVQDATQLETEMRTCILTWLSGTGLTGAYTC